MDRQEIIDMTLDMKLAADRKRVLSASEYVKCGGCPDLYPKAYQEFTGEHCVPCHLEKTYGIIFEEGIENVPALLMKLPQGMHTERHQVRDIDF